MLKWRDFPFAIAMANFLAVLAAMLWLYSWPSYPSQYQNHGNQNQTYANSTNPSAMTAAQEAAQEAHAENTEHAVTDWWIVRTATIACIIGAAQFIMFWLQLSAMRSGLADTATQVKIAQDTFEKLERPYLYISTLGKLSMDKDGLAYIDYSVVNHGKIPAIVDTVYVSLGPSKTGEPAHGYWEMREHRLRAKPVIGPSKRRKNIPARAPGTTSLAPAMGNEITITPSPGEESFLQIKLTYNGPFTRGHSTMATWRLDRHSNRFVECFSGDEKYNHIK
jgi:hypothetical protein